MRALAAVVLVVLAVAGGPAGAVVESGSAEAGSSRSGWVDARQGWRYVRGGDFQPVAPSTRAMPDGRTAYDTGHVPFAAAGAVGLVHPAAVVERIGFHQSNHEGAREQAVAATAAGPVLLPDRGRLSSRHSSADVVVAPDTEVRAPVTGTVLRSGTYVLYCRYSDDYAVIAPDAQPAWEVKVLHIDGVQVQPGDRVVAGVTVLAPRATVLPFTSQVDAHTADPAWPHVHLEVIDPSIPDVPNGGSGSGC